MFSITNLQQPFEATKQGSTAGVESQSEPLAELKSLEGERIGSAGNAMTNRIPYHNGYGDLFFGSPGGNERQQMEVTEDMSEEEKQDRMGITGSNGVPIAELDKFKRYEYHFIVQGVWRSNTDVERSSGTFEYTKLPLEVRQRILRMVLQPLFSSWFMEIRKSIAQYCV